MFAMKALSILALVAHAVTAADPLQLMPIPPAGISQCGQITFSWHGGVTPFSLFLMKSKAGPVIKVFPIILNRAYDWKVSLPEGTDFVVQLQSGAEANGSVKTITSNSYTILGSSDRSCVNTAIFEYPVPSPSRPIPPKPSLTMVPAHPVPFNPPSSAKSHTIPIVLGVLGGLVVLLLVVLGLLFRARRKAQVVDPEMDPAVLAGGKMATDDDDDELDIKKPLPTYANK